MTLPAAKDLLPILPELTLVLGGLTILTAAIVAQHTRRLSALLALGTLAIALLLTLFTPDSARFASFGGMLLSDGLTDAARLVILLAAGAASIVCLLHALPRPPSRGNAPHGVVDPSARTNPPEYFLLLLGAATGLCLLASTTNLLVIFLAMELASLPSYVLAGWRKDTRHAAEASLKYVLLGSVAAAMFAFGASILFACYNTLDVAAIAAATTPAPLPLAAVGVWAIALGIAFKIAAVPMHFWCPDVFQGATADIGLFLSVASKAAALILAARLVILTVPALPEGQIADTANLLLAIVAIATMTLANLAALSATSLKRLAGWSSIAHAGYMLSLLVLTSHAPDLRSALVAYLTVYLIMNTGFFAAIAAIEAFEQSDRLDKLHRLARTHPVLSASLAVCIISLIGLPPTAGFTAKLLVLLALPSAGLLGWTLAVAIVINTVLSLAYYLPILRRIYLPTGDPTRPDRTQTDPTQTDQTLTHPSEATHHQTGTEPSLALASAARPSIFLCLICAILLILMFLFQGLLLPWLPL